MALGQALPKPILCNNPYFLVSTDRYGLRQRQLYNFEDILFINIDDNNLIWSHLNRIWSATERPDAVFPIRHEISQSPV